jgi:tripartite-type tricarboxylate transporter receptor subunit TctC
MKKLFTLLFATTLLISTASSAMEFTVHHGPGGPSDRGTRTLSKYLPDDYIVINRPGAGGRIATKHLIKNNTMMLATVGQIFVTNNLVSQPAGYLPEQDLEIIGNLAIMPNVMVCKTELGYHKLSDIGNKSLNFAVAGIGSSEHIATEALFTKISGKHLSIPYAQGGASGINDLLGGRIDCMFANYPTVKPFINDPKLTIIFSSHDVGLNVPTWRELFKESFPFQSYLSIVISKQMPSEEKDKVVQNIKIAFGNTELRNDLKLIGLFPVLNTDISSVDRSILNLTNFIKTSNLKIE